MRLDRLRNEIDGIDSMLLELFSNRMERMAQIAQEKQRLGMPVDVPGREREILSRIAERAEPAHVGYAKVFFSTVFDVSRAYQHGALRHGDGVLAKRIGDAIAAMPGRVFPEKAIVALPGVQGSFAHIACQKMFVQADTLHCRDYRSVLDALGKGLCQFGILPLESGGYASVGEIYALLRESGCYIVHGAQVCMDYALLGLPGTDPAQVVEVFADAPAAGQCGQFFRGNRSVEITLCDNSAHAVARVKASGRANAAAIAPLSLAEHAGLAALGNVKVGDELSAARYVCVAKELAIYPGADTVSLMLTIPDAPGALCGLAMQFAALDVKLSRLESRRPREDGLLYIDLQAQAGISPLLTLLDELATGPEQVKFLGWHREV